MLTDTFNIIGTAILLNESHDQLRLKLKKCFGMKTKNSCTLVPDPECKSDAPDDGPESKSSSDDGSGTAVVCSDNLDQPNDVPQYQN